MKYESHSVRIIVYVCECVHVCLILYLSVSTFKPERPTHPVNKFSNTFIIYAWTDNPFYHSKTTNQKYNSTKRDNYYFIHKIKKNVFRKLFSIDAMKMHRKCESLCYGKAIFRLGNTKYKLDLGNRQEIETFAFTEKLQTIQNFIWEHGSSGIKFN